MGAATGAVHTTTPEGGPRILNGNAPVRLSKHHYHYYCKQNYQSKNNQSNELLPDDKDTPANLVRVAGYYTGEDKDGNTISDSVISY